ncbi:DUF6445 family protein [Microbulbifer hydrolyticus]|uniref:Uncharacterized protein n=1 Tax=Microbulbifer hydrolyticus TaxID=48074 RepID=A0A6P1TCJ6_9GAMM|nr:DUF6445 family protein [Microbulbifer hydrolyticus]MBB5211903.1 hypothetical protein [Microbulbifer hydrolyticus]QHQ40514.1 hypothetical protein GTQ55_17050 [Microbulbifer hydrolyticus]
METGVGKFACAAEPRCEVVSVGNEQLPVLVVDGLAAEPELLLEYAAAAPGFSARAGDYYPGLRKPLPSAYTENLCATLDKTLREVFQLPSTAAAEPLLCALSIATTPAEKLRPIQRLPHFDSSDPNQLAVVHYLCPPQLGGTAFYRHRASGFESIDADRLYGYAAALKQQVMASPPQGYTSGDSQLFVQTARFDAQFNRALIYRGNQLHSGLINATTGLSADPRAGRLTATSFIRFTR